ncbi:MAG: hypothetical protein GX142_00360 [Chloroflexi bacterium]|nr:hypothetical protein [Chloroflexota bacterium]
MKNRILQAYQQAPWRTQIQWVGLFLLGLVLIASITGVYLNISAQAATSGRRIQFLEYEIDVINNEIAELTSLLAKEKSVEVMKSKAEAMGYVPLNPYDAVYLEISGYNPLANVVLAPPRVNTVSETPTILSSYKTSLWQWLVQNIWQSPSDEIQAEGELLP